MSLSNNVSCWEKILIEFMVLYVRINLEEDQVKFEFKAPEPPLPVVPIIMPE